MPRKAFTLLELMLTMAVIAVVAAVSYPTLTAMYGGFKIQAATDTVRAAWAECRSRAINEGRAYRFSIAPGKANFRVAPDSPEFWSGNSGPSDADGPALVREDAVADGVSLTPGSSAAGAAEGGSTVMPPGGVDLSSWVTTVVFLPDGTCRDDAELSLHVRGARSVCLKLRGLTGVVTVRYL